MKKLLQTRIHSNENGQLGNCYAAVIACFMDLESAEDAIQIQEHYHLDDWIYILLHWLEQKGWSIDTLHGHVFDGSYYLVSGLSINNNRHICIYQNGELFWDPQPNGQGLISENFFYSLQKIFS